MVQATPRCNDHDFWVTPGVDMFTSRTEPIQWATIQHSHKNYLQTIAAEVCIRPASQHTWQLTSLNHQALMGEKYIHSKAKARQAPCLPKYYCNHARAFQSHAIKLVYN